MKIAIISDTLYPFVKGGADKRYHEIAKYLVAQGHEVHVFTLRWWGDEKSIVRDGMRLHGVCDPMPLYVKGRRSIREAIVFAMALPWSLMRHRFDVIECNVNPFLHCFPIRVISWIYRTKLVFGLWECWGNYWFDYLGPRGIMGWLMERLAIMLPNKIIVESQSNKDILVSWGVNPGKISRIPSGVHFSMIQDVPKADGKLDLIVVGRMIRAKGAHTFLNALPKVIEQNSSLRVGIVGDGPEMENLRQISSNLGLDSYIEFYGFVPEEKDVIALMKTAKIFVYPAAMEGGWALTAIEANASGLPTIGVEKGDLGITEAVIEGFNGVLIPEENADLLAEKINEVLKDDNARSNMSANAVDFARQHDWHDLANQIENVYEEVYGR